MLATHAKEEATNAEEIEVNDKQTETNVEKANPKIDLSPNARSVLEKRYLRKDRDGKVIETPEGMFRRVARNIASAEKIFDENADIKAVEEEFYEIMAGLEFIPNSPTLMNAGRDLQQLAACFVLPIDDSIDSIFEVIKNTALIHKSGGGTGFSFSRIRPRNDIVSTSHGMSSGPLSFMKVFNEATEAINQGGFRRGANMAVLRVDHPDILQFITAKKDNDQMTNFNISVGITKLFMEALERDGEYELINPHYNKTQGTLKATEVFNLIVEMAWKNGEPGIVFLDRLNAANPTPALGEIESTNPCGEQPLLPYEACNLGSINLARMAGNGEINFEHLRKIVHLAVKFLDDVIEVNKYPMEKIEKMVRKNRKVGLGVMGFADLLISLGIPYNSEKAISTGENIMKFIQQEAKHASIKLAETRGSFPSFKGSIHDVPGAAPLRNATVTTIAPTGTISIIAGSSSGIEPLYAIAYSRNVMDGTELVECHPAFQRAVKEQGLFSEKLIKDISDEGTIKSIDGIPDSMKKIFVTAHDIGVEWHIRMQAAFQKHTDNAVSKTVNFRRDATTDDVSKVYRMAYKLGCKGVTVYRDGSREDQVLSVKKKPEDVPSKKLVPRTRPKMLSGKTYKMPTGCGSLYVTVNDDENGQPFEVFAELGKAGGCAASQCQGMGRLLSLALRSGIDGKEIVKQMNGISCHSPVGLGPAKVRSCSDGIAKAMLRHFERGSSSAHKPPDFHVKLMVGACPECGGQVEHEGGCVVCHLCGYSKCG